MADRIVLITENQWDRNQARLKYLERKVASIRGDGVTNSIDCITIAWPPRQRNPMPPRMGSNPDVVIVKLTANESGGGKYAGRILTGSSSALVATNLSAGDLGNVPSEDDALVLNLQEMGQSTHDIDVAGTQIYFVGLVIGVTSEDNARRIVVIDGTQWENCT